MDVWDLILRQHAITHSAEVAGEAGDSLGDDPFAEMTDDQVRRQLHGLNSVAWLIWHIARCEDVVATTILARQHQVLDEGDWPGRLRVHRRDIGAEMTTHEVGELSAVIDIPSLRAYRVAVGRRTSAWIQSLPTTGLDEVIPEEGVRDALAQGALIDKARPIGDFWLKRPKPWFLYWEIIGHNYVHLGQALWVRRLVKAETDGG